MSTFFKNRRLRVSYTVCKSIWKRSLKPKLTLSGDWIQKAGFDIGEDVFIKVEHGKIIISKND